MIQLKHQRSITLPQHYDLATRHPTDLLYIYLCLCINYFQLKLFLRPFQPLFYLFTYLILSLLSLFQKRVNLLAHAIPNRST